MMILMSGAIPYSFERGIWLFTDSQANIAHVKQPSVGRGSSSLKFVLVQALMVL